MRSVRGLPLDPPVSLSHPCMHTHMHPHMPTHSSSSLSADLHLHSSSSARLGTLLPSGAKPCRCLVLGDIHSPILGYLLPSHQVRLHIFLWSQTGTRNCDGSRAATVDARTLTHSPLPQPHETEFLAQEIKVEIREKIGVDHMAQMLGITP